MIFSFIFFLPILEDKMGGGLDWKGIHLEDNHGSYGFPYDQNGKGRWDTKGKSVKFPKVFRLVTFNGSWFECYTRKQISLSKKRE